MIRLTFKNVEQIIFYDKVVQRILPELSPVFQKWTLGIRAGLTSVTKDALLDFLNNVTPEQLDKIGSYLGTPVTVQKMNSSLVKNFETDVKSLEGKLKEPSDFQGNVCIAREGDLIYVCLWR